MIRTKKSLGQHFLIKEEIAQAISDAVLTDSIKKVLEVGPGTGMLSKYLLDKEGIDLSVIELDARLPDYLVKEYPRLKGKYIEADFLKFDIEAWTKEKFILAGNYPYNISSQIFFRMLDHKDQIIQMVGMFQKEVAQRIVADPATKAYGILSVLAQAYYHTEYLFDVAPDSFNPPPRVNSGVIRLVRKVGEDENFEYKKLRIVVKKAFNQRRKKLSNSLKGLEIDTTKIPTEMLNDRPDRLSVDDFIFLSQLT